MSHLAGECPIWRTPCAVPLWLSTWTQRPSKHIGTSCVKATLQLLEMEMLFLLLKLGAQSHKVKRVHKVNRVHQVKRVEQPDVFAW